MRRLLLLPVLTLMAMLFVATSANAAAVTSFTVNGSADDLTVAPGADVLLDWTVEATGDPEGEVTVTAAGGAAGQVEDWSGTVASPTALTLTEPGTYEFAISVVESGVDGLAQSDTVTVTVEATDDLVEVTPEPVTFPGECVVDVPSAEGYFYAVLFGDFGDIVDPTGRRNLSDYFNGGDPITFLAVPRDGFTFPEGTQTEYEVTVSPDCVPSYVDAVPICRGVTFTNVSGEAILVDHVAYDPDADPADVGRFELAAGATRTVDTTRGLLFFVAGRVLDLDDTVQTELIEVEQDCERPTAAAAATRAHPTVAPAAGSGSGSGPVLGALAALVLAAGVVGARRRLSA